MQGGNEKELLQWNSHHSHARKKNSFRFTFRTRRIRHVRWIRWNKVCEGKKSRLVRLFLRSDCLSGGISVDCTTPRGSRGTGSFTCSVAVGRAIAGLGSGPDGFARGVSVRCPVSGLCRRSNGLSCGVTVDCARKMHPKSTSCSFFSFHSNAPEQLLPWHLRDLPPCDTISRLHRGLWSHLRHCNSNGRD